MEQAKAEKAMTLADRIKQLDVKVTNADSGFERTNESQERYERKTIIFRE